MLENNDDKNIDWDKMTDLLDGKRSLVDLTDDELRLLAAAREMKARLALTGISVEEGWQGFDAKRKKARTVRMRSLAVAATIVLAISIGLWMFAPLSKTGKQPAQLANAQPSGKVQLKLGNGTIITPGSTSQTIQHGDEAVVKLGSTSVTYEGGNTAGELLAMDTLEVPRGLQFDLQLADGTQVWLNSDSRLFYPAVFKGSTREVYVEGEAFFAVKTNASQPFIVHAGNNSLKVLGTSFNINTFDNAVTTTLTTGRLVVSANDQQQLLDPGEQTMYRSGMLDKQTVDTHIYTAWKDGDLFFEDATLRDITTYLARNYDYNFEFNDPSLESVKFTLDIRRPAHLQDALDLISKSLSDIHFSVHHKTVQVKKLSGK
jgi:transmembrane sensor